MTLEFNPGNYAIQLGRTVLDKTNHNYYTLRFNSKLDPSLPSRKANLRQEKDAYFADWFLDDNVMSYEGAQGNMQEMECLLIFDEETQTFTLERPTAKMTMKKVRKKKPTPSKDLSKSSTTKSTTVQQPSTTKKNWLSNNNDEQQPSPISLALPPQQKDTPTTPPSINNDNNDSFDVDILRDMDEILNSNDDDDDDDDDDDEEEFETITSPHLSTDAINKVNPPSNSPQPIMQQQQQQTTKRRRPPLKMASVPIRRLDASPPTPAPGTSSLPQANKRPRIGGKTTSAATLAARRKAASAIRSESSSDSSSSSGSESSSDDSGSSSSDSDDDDDDMDLLAENISRGLSEDDIHASPLTRLETTPMRQSPHQQPMSTPHRGTAGPTSLRDLLDGDQRDDDDVSSSGSSSDDDS
ncbi:uncharacterized protein BX664DRAFT_324381 [Halteromyces radiatus]|uniref:uncharacterized protein n=1 Tax=Halteromyces radiatus TaxID=101107 RepID=UPI00221ED3F4|nr:uncharacterized protein BX664DRAFT_324381 [Halteromyces radiatus]KAI8096610.1 hypothetical protein BX664DRAFT_324381 [Halteromyces radiatus]